MNERLRKAGKKLVPQLKITGMMRGYCVTPQLPALSMREAMLFANWWWVYGAYSLASGCVSGLVKKGRGKKVKMAQLNELSVPQVLHISHALHVLYPSKDKKDDCWMGEIHESFLDFTYIMEFELIADITADWKRELLLHKIEMLIISIEGETPLLGGLTRRIFTQLNLIRSSTYAHSNSHNNPIVLITLTDSQNTRLRICDGLIITVLFMIDLDKNDKKKRRFKINWTVFRLFRSLLLIIFVYDVNCRIERQIRALQSRSFFQ